MPQIVVLSANGERKEIQSPRGLSLMEALRRGGLPVLGECNGSMACATCHVIVEPPWFDVVGGPSDAEEDILDVAFGLTATSRLSCQITLSDALDGLTVRLPR